MRQIEIEVTGRQGGAGAILLEMVADPEGESALRLGGKFRAVNGYFKKAFVIVGAE